MPGLLRGMARTTAIVGTANAVSHKQQQKWANQAAAQQQAAAPAPVAAAPIASVDDQVAQLEKLAQLKEQGILTQAEFDAKKHQILGL